VNAALERSGLPIPKFAVVRRGSAIPSVGYPAICKPAAEDASIGVEQRSVVRSSRELTERVGTMLERWDEVLVQKFVEGREVNIGVLGDAVLPIAEIDFGRMPKGMWRIVTYRSKWEDGSDEDLGSAPRCPARLPATLATQLRKIAVAAWRIVGGSGYGRVDMRIDERGRPWILEVNANPDFAPTAGLARMAGVAGIDYGALVRQVCELGLQRSREQSSTAERWALAQRLSGVAPESTEPDLFPAGVA
jgi:D-alanine-D-alanine ligase